jgi:uncharacterized protein (DUF1501 family)
MIKPTHASRRTFLRHAGTLTTAAGFHRFATVNALAQTAADYKALVCVFLLGGNDSHNMVIPLSGPNAETYKSVRSSLALPNANATLLPVTATDGAAFGLNSGLTAIHPLWAQRKLAVMANVGVLTQPTTRAQYLAGTALPSNLFSHSDQVIAMQTANVAGSGGTGWAGRVADSVNPLNGGSSFPASISMAGSVLFCTGNIVQSASLLPGFDLTASGLGSQSDPASQTKMNALQEILTLDSGLSLVQAANKVRQDAFALSAMLKSAGSRPGFSAEIPGTSIGRQLKQVAQIMQLRSATGMKRQVFFCSLGGFDTHSSQSWAQWDLLRQVSEAMGAFYNATEEMGIADKVTSFTESDFGRTLQPSGSGSDHGWGSHHLVLGGAVLGGDIYGRFPTLALGGPDDSGTRGALIPTTSIDQYGATLARWFGVADNKLEQVFSAVRSFPSSSLGFLA